VTKIKFVSGVVDTAKQFIAGIVDTAYKHSFAIISTKFRNVETVLMGYSGARGTLIRVRLPLKIPSGQIRSTSGTIGQALKRTSTAIGYLP
jgi:hypothetical protein